jgi:hypothetical protein
MASRVEVRKHGDTLARCHDGTRASLCLEPAMQEQARELERLASDMHAVAFDFAEPARSLRFAEERIAEVERICAAARALVRGRSICSR